MSGKVSVGIQVFRDTMENRPRGDIDKFLEENMPTSGTMLAIERSRTEVVSHFHHRRCSPYGAIRTERGVDVYVRRASRLVNVRTADSVNQAIMISHERRSVDPSGSGAAIP